MNTDAARIPAYEDLSSVLDFHLLRPELSDEEIAEGCRMARELAMRSLLVRPADVDSAVRWIGSSPVLVGSVAGYPDGSSTTAAKLYEGRDLLRRGAREIEMVVNTGKLVSREFQYVEMELLQMAKSCHEAGASFTTVVRNELLADDLKIIVTKICRRVEADALSIVPVEADLALLRPVLKDQLKLKSRSEVSTLEDALVLRDAGYSRTAAAKPASVLAQWKTHIAQLEREAGGSKQA
jgi:deoxyribose-phosphate aldolase